jgi:hypothetical protein
METNTHSKKVQKHIEDLEYAFKNYSLVEIELRGYSVIYANSYRLYEQFYDGKDYTHIDLFFGVNTIAKVYIRNIIFVNNAITSILKLIEDNIIKDKEDKL